MRLFFEIYVLPIFIINFFFLLTPAKYGPDPANVPSGFMCAWRELSYNYSNTLRPDVADLVYDALDLDHYCNGSIPRPQPASLSTLYPLIDEAAFVKGTPQFYVDVVNGHDSYPGTADKPVQTIEQALSLSRKVAGAKQILLKAGTFYLTNPLQLDTQDSFLTITNFPGDEVWLSGATPVSKDITWAPVHSVDKTQPSNSNTGSTIWVADVSSLGIKDLVLALRVNGQRAWPARYPNANPETDIFPIGYLPSNKTDWLPPKIAPKPNPATEVVVASPNRTWDSQFNQYLGGIGGTCAVYDPPFSYWCTSNFSVGCGGCFTWNIQGG